MKWLKWTARSGYSGKRGIMLDEIEALLVVIGSCLQWSGPHAVHQLTCPTPRMGEKTEPCQEQSHHMSDSAEAQAKQEFKGPRCTRRSRGRKVSSDRPTRRKQMERRRGLPVQRTESKLAAGALCHLLETGSHRPATSQWSIDATCVLVKCNCGHLKPVGRASLEM